MASTTSTTESRAISLLGQGLGPEMVASAIGVSVSRISQLLSDPEFSSKVAELRFTSLAKHNERDQKYDRMEEDLQDKLADLIPFMVNPVIILRAIQTINSAKRRGSSAPEAIHGQQTVVQLMMPTQIINNFTSNNLTLNSNNQVVKAGGQDLVTVQSGSMDKLLARSKGTSDVQTSLTLPAPKT